MFDCFTDMLDYVESAKRFYAGMGKSFEYDLYMNDKLKLIIKVQIYGER